MLKPSIVIFVCFLWKSSVVAEIPEEVAGSAPLFIKKEILERRNAWCRLREEYTKIKLYNPTDMYFLVRGILDRNNALIRKELEASAGISYSQCKENLKYIRIDGTVNEVSTLGTWTTKNNEGWPLSIILFQNGLIRTINGEFKIYKTNSDLFPMPNFMDIGKDEKETTYDFQWLRNTVKELLERKSNRLIDEISSHIDKTIQNSIKGKDETVDLKNKHEQDNSETKNLESEVNQNFTSEEKILEIPKFSWKKLSETSSCGLSYDKILMFEVKWCDLFSKAFKDEKLIDELMKLYGENYHLIVNKKLIRSKKDLKPHLKFVVMENKGKACTDNFDISSISGCKDLALVEGPLFGKSNTDIKGRFKENLALGKNGEYYIKNSTLYHLA